MHAVFGWKWWTQFLCKYNIVMSAIESNNYKNTSDRKKISLRVCKTQQTLLTTVNR